MALRIVWTATLLLALVRVFAQAPSLPVPNPATTNPPNTFCKVSGQVLRTSDGTPIKGASVQIYNELDRENAILTKTTSEGKFQLRDIAPGRYKLIVNKNGYVQAEYAQRKLTDPGGVLTLLAGQDKNDILFRLVPAGVITGRVFDEDGEPVAYASVSAARTSYTNGKRTLDAAATVSSNDLGEYRLFGLAPGKYFVSAADPKWHSGSGQTQSSETKPASGNRSSAKTYYPGVVETFKAIPLFVKAGDELTAIDIPLKQVAVYRIRGRVFTTAAKATAPGTLVMLQPRDVRDNWDEVSTKQVQNADGTFELADISPGEYELLAYGVEQTKMYVARQPITVATGDIDGIVLTLLPGIGINGSVVWHGNPDMAKAVLTVSLQPTMNDSSIRFGGYAKVDSSGSFTAESILEAEYKVAIDGLGKDSYIESVRYGDSPSRDGTIAVSKGGGPPLNIVLSSRGARVQGSVADENGLPLSGVTVLAVPDGDHRKNTNLFKRDLTDQYGRFDLRGMAPGAYKLFCWESVEDGAWEDPEFLKPLEDKAVSVELKEEDKKNVTLTPLPQTAETPN